MKQKTYKKGKCFLRNYRTALKKLHNEFHELYKKFVKLKLL